MADDLDPILEVMRRSADECIAEYQQMVETGEIITLRNGEVADFPTVYMASRLVSNGYADAFKDTDYWDTDWFADHLLDYIESEIVSGTALPDGQFALDLAFLMLWQVVAELLSEVIARQQEAMLRLKGKEVPSMESRPVIPEEWQRLTGQ